MAADTTTLDIQGHSLRMSNLSKVLYPETGTTKRDVLDYLRAVAGTMLPHCAGRPATRKRWPDGVGTAKQPGQVFFTKNLEPGSPDWITTVDIEHSDHTNTYPLVDDEATLAWLAQVAALELHVPQWRVDDNGRPCNPDRLVLDLDPGEGVGLAECVDVAKLARTLLQDVGLDPVPVTSGSTGVHIYAALDGSYDASYMRDFAHELARSLQADHPDLVESKMSKELREGKVFVDWSQNHPNKTTIAPYSLRGRQRPMVAAPRTWRELAHPKLRQLEYGDVLKRLNRRGDPMAELAPGAEVAPQSESVPKEGPSGEEPSRDRLKTYRSKRRAPTSEPVPSQEDEDEPAAQRNSMDRQRGDNDAPIFVIQRHDASQLHDDLRLEREGVLVSWALPKGIPTSTKKNRLAVHTEDHPMSYADFEGEIPRGSYGAGNVDIWDHGTYELTTWEEEKVVVTLHGQPDGGLQQEGPGGATRIALIHTGGRGGQDENNWLIHLMSGDEQQDTDDEATTSAATSRAGRGDGVVQRAVTPMLATLGSESDIADPSQWAMEMKWDGIRAIAVLNGEDLRLVSRNGNDMTHTYPELGALRECLGHQRALLDGEIVALDSHGRPDFHLLQHRISLQDAEAIRRAAREQPCHLMLFDALHLDEDLMRRSYRTRRNALIEAIDTDVSDLIEVPPAFEGDLEAALDTSRQWQLEGVIAKRLSSRYSPAKRSPSWIKLKHVRTQEAVVIGWQPGKGSRSGMVGSLLLALPDDDGELRYIGKVGTGFSQAEADNWTAALTKQERRTPPAQVPTAVAKQSRWLTPRNVAEVAFSEWTATGSLRHPRWRGWRIDKEPADVAVE